MKATTCPHSFQIVIFKSCKQSLTVPRKLNSSFLGQIIKTEREVTEKETQLSLLKHKEFK
jgi:hypothetical protein